MKRLLFSDYSLKRLLFSDYSVKRLLFSEYSVKNLEGLSVGLNGLGPLNWIAKKVRFYNLLLQYNTFGNLQIYESK